MKINGKEYGLFLTIRAWTEICELCPDGDFGKVGDLLQGKGQMMNVVRILASLSRGYADHEVTVEGHERPEVLTEAYLSSLSPFILAEAGVVEEITTAMQGGTAQEIETEPVKGKNVEGAATA